MAASYRLENLHALIRRRIVVTATLSVVYLVATIALGRPYLAPLVVTLAGRGLNRDWVALGQNRGSRAATPALVQGGLALAGSLLVTGRTNAGLPIAVAYGAALLLSLVLNPPPGVARPAQRPAAVAPWMLFIVMAGQVMASTDTILLAAFRSTEETGIYAAVYRIPNAWLTLAGLLVLGLIPEAARKLRDDPGQLAELRDRAVRTGRIWGTVTLLIIPPAYLLAPTLFGHSYRAGQIPLVILLFATAVNVIAAPLHPLWFGLDRDRDLALTVIGVAVANVAVNLVAIPRWGMTGAAITTLGAQILLLVLLRNGLAHFARKHQSHALIDA